MTVRVAVGTQYRLVLPLVTTIAALAAGAALLRRQPLSWDEAVTVAVATRPVHDIVGTLGHTDAVLGAYYLLMHGWAGLLSGAGIQLTETWWRLPSAAASVVTCATVALLARRQAGQGAALLAGGCFAVLPLSAFYTVDARPYTLAAATITTAWCVWTRASPRGRSLLTTTVTVLLLVAAAWLQLFTVLVWPAFVLVVGRQQVRTALRLLLPAGLGVVPLLVVALGQSSEIAWVPPASWSNTVGVGLHVGGGLAVVTLLVALAVLAARQGLLHRSPMSLAIGWWVAAPFAVLAALDVVRPVLVARYALVSLPLVAVALGVLVTRASDARAGRRAIRAVGAAVVVAALVTTTVQVAQPWKYEDYRGAAAFAGRAATPGTAVLFVPSSARLGFDLYDSGSGLRDVALPHGVGRDPLAIAETTPPLLQETVAAACRLVLVGDPVTPSPAAGVTGTDRAKLSAVSGWADVAVGHFGAVTVSVLANPACSTHAPAASPRS